jgi:hypothetical protein
LAAISSESSIAAPSAFANNSRQMPRTEIVALASSSISDRMPHARHSFDCDQAVAPSVHSESESMHRGSEDLLGSLAVTLDDAAGGSFEEFQVAVAKDR